MIKIDFDLAKELKIIYAVSLLSIMIGLQAEISDHQQSWGYEDGPWKGPGPPLLGGADF